MGCRVLVAANNACILYKYSYVQFLSIDIDLLQGRLKGLPDCPCRRSVVVWSKVGSLEGRLKHH
jgi:hypothetical protein